LPLRRSSSNNHDPSTDNKTRICIYVFSYSCSIFCTCIIFMFVRHGIPPHSFIAGRYLVLNLYKKIRKKSNTTHTHTHVRSSTNVIHYVPSAIFTALAVYDGSQDIPYTTHRALSCDLSCPFIQCIPVLSPFYIWRWCYFLKLFPLLGRVEGVKGVVTGLVVYVSYGKAIGRGGEGGKGRRLGKERKFRRWGFIKS
jgi:heme/copper-type cytochrome/quinol oxidase subunit 4